MYTYYNFFIMISMHLVGLKNISKWAIYFKHDIIFSRIFSRNLILVYFLFLLIMTSLLVVNFLLFVTHINALCVIKMFKYFLSNMTSNSTAFSMNCYNYSNILFHFHHLRINVSVENYLFWITIITPCFEDVASIKRKNSFL